MKTILTTCGLVLAPALVWAVAAPQSKPLPAAPNGFDVRRENIERGKVETVEYDSKSVGAKRKMVIYTPPGYSKDTKYPVLYLLHGSGDDETGWIRKGAAAEILDNLYAEKKLAPMIVVMPNGFARPSAQPDAAPKGKPEQNPSGRPGRSRGAGRNSAFEADLLKDIIPYVESHYPVKSGPENRAIAGLSMGGGQALRIGLKHLDTFAWVGGFSSALFGANRGDLVPAEGKGLRLLWLSCGDADRLMDGSKAFHTSLEEKNVPHVWHVDTGGHAWPVWKNDLYLLSQMLFRDKPEGDK